MGAQTRGAADLFSSRRFIMTKGYEDFCGKFEMRHLEKRLLYRLAKTVARNICIYNRRNGAVAFSTMSLH